jgi:flagellar basal body P-ring formation protein FlgA
MMTLMMMPAAKHSLLSLSPPPLWGRVREGGTTRAGACGLPLSHKGRGKSKSGGVHSVLLANAMPAVTPAVAALRALLSLSPPPLWGRVREGGTTRAGACGLPLSPTLSHKGRGKSKTKPRGVRSLLLETTLLDAASAAFAMRALLSLSALTPAVAAMRGLLFLSPPPRNRGLPLFRILISRKSGRPDLRWGRAREGGKPQAPACAVPLSPTLPHKGGGSRKSVPTLRSLLLATALLAFSAATAPAQVRDDVIAAPVLRANVTVSGDLVRIGDVIDNAGTSAQIAIYRAPDLGTTGSLPTAQVISALRAHQVIGVDTRDISAISVTRLARTLESRDIELQVARALEHRGGLGEAANLSLTFDRDVQDLKLEASNSGAMQVSSARFEPRNNRFDVMLEIASDSGSAPTRLRFTGTAIETVEAAVLARGVERNEVLKSSDVVTERRPKAEVGNDVAVRDRAVGMQARKQLRAGQALKTADLAKPDLVQRDQSVTLTFESPGLYLSVRGKALEGGTEGDVVNVLNLQSKRTISGVVTGRGQVSVSVATPRLPAPDTTSSIAPDQTAAPVSLAASTNPPAVPKPE